jgi:hypothetical protein
MPPEQAAEEREPGARRGPRERVAKVREKFVEDVTARAVEGEEEEKEGGGTDNE